AGFPPTLPPEILLFIKSGWQVQLRISLLHLNMRGRQRDNIHTPYKRASSRDRLNAQDREDGLGGNPNPVQNNTGKGYGNPPWIRSLPHVIVAAFSSFLFGYHLGVVNDTLESISLDLSFHGDTMAEGLVVSTCLGGAFIGSTVSGWIADGIGRRRAFQLCAIPLIIGASMSATANGLGGMLFGRFLVGTGMGVTPPVAALYITEVSPAFVRGTYGSFTQIATCLGLIASFFIGIPAKDVPRWWRVCFWVSTVPAALLALLMEFCAESPHWLLKVITYNIFLFFDIIQRGRSAEAEAEFGKLLGGLHVKSSMAEFSKSDRADEVESVKLSELLYGRHFRVVFIGSALLALQQLSGINAVFYFSSTVFKSGGVPSDIANMSVGVVNLSGSIVAMVLMDKLGRKGLLLGSFMGMVCSSVVYLSVGGVLLFVLSFAMGVGPVPGLLLSEIFPSRIRAKAMAICMAVHWVNAESLSSTFGAICSWELGCGFMLLISWTLLVEFWCEICIGRTHSRSLGYNEQGNILPLPY
ncbi:General substrate transporter, partial [Cynara cardunculus var. scolymus]